MLTIEIKDVPAIFGLLNYHDVNAAARAFNKIILGSAHHEQQTSDEQQSIDEIMNAENNTEKTVEVSTGDTSDTSLLDAFDDICGETTTDVVEPTTVIESVEPTATVSDPVEPVEPTTVIEPVEPTTTLIEPSPEQVLGVERTITHTFEKATADPKNKGIAKIAPKAFDHFKKHNIDIIARKQFYSKEFTTENKNKYELTGAVDALTDCQIISIRTRLADIKTSNANYETIVIRMQMRIIDNDIYKKTAVLFQHTPKGDFKYSNVKNMASSVKKDTEKINKIVDALSDIVNDPEVNNAYVQGSTAERLSMLTAVGLI